MLETLTLLDGSFSANDIELAHATGSYRQVSNDLHKQIDTIWDQTVKEAEQKGLKLWDSISYRLVSCKTEGKKALLTVDTISYKDNLALTSLLIDGKLDDSYATNLMYCNLLIKTSDGKYLFGCGGERHTWHEDVKCAGGSYCKDELELATSQALFLQILNELEEEMGIRKETVENLKLRTIFRTTRGLTAFVFTAHTSISSEEARELFDSVVHKEFTQLLTLNPEKTKQLFLQRGRHFLEMIKLIT